MFENRFMAIRRQAAFNARNFLAHDGEGRRATKYGKDQIVFSQGKPADAIYYIQKGKAKLIVSFPSKGKEAVVAIISADEFFGGGCIASQPLRTNRP